MTMSGKDPTKKLLNLAIKAGTENNAGTPGRISSDADKRWLDEAMKDITSSHINLVDRLKECLQILETSDVDKSISADDVEATMEEISSLCEDVDLACDLHKIGGFPVILKFLNQSDFSLRFGAADIIAVISQNNEYCQNILLKEYDILKTLLDMTLVHNSDLESNVATKSMYAVSCLIRHNSSGIEKFLTCDGFSYLLQGIQAQVPKLRIKSIFLLSSLSKENKEVQTALNNDDYAVSLLEALKLINDFDVIEFALDALVTLNCHNADFRSKCKEKSKEFKLALENLLSNDVVKSDREEITNYCNQLFKILNLKMLSQA